MNPFLRLCQCSHGEAMHDFRKDGTRSVCSVHTGRDATPCSCRSYAPQVSQTHTTSQEHA